MGNPSIKERLRIIIFGTETPAGKRFDVVLLWLILLSVVVVILESIPKLAADYQTAFYTLEWVLTGLFTLEYFLRIWVSKDRSAYIFSYFGIIDFLAISPAFLGLIFSGYHVLSIIRILRLLRVFRVLRLLQFMREGEALMKALKSSFYKISIFMSFMFAFVILLGTLMYVIESGNDGFDSIPTSIYWAIVTITTVGYGDIVPITVVGKVLSSLTMLLGYAIIAVPTGIVTVEASRAFRNTQKECPDCQQLNDDSHNYCSNCGMFLRKNKTMDHRP